MNLRHCHVCAPSWSWQNKTENRQSIARHDHFAVHYRNEIIKKTETNWCARSASNNVDCYINRMEFHSTSNLHSRRCMKRNHDWNGSVTRSVRKRRAVMALLCENKLSAPNLEDSSQVVSWCRHWNYAKIPLSSIVGWNKKRPEVLRENLSNISFPSSSFFDWVCVRLRTYWG